MSVSDNPVSCIMRPTGHEMVEAYCGRTFTAPDIPDEIRAAIAICDSSPDDFMPLHARRLCGPWVRLETSTIG